MNQKYNPDMSSAELQMAHRRIDRLENAVEGLVRVFSEVMPTAVPALHPLVDSYNQGGQTLQAVSSLLVLSGGSEQFRRAYDAADEAGRARLEAELPARVENPLDANALTTILKDALFLNGSLTVDFIVTELPSLEELSKALSAGPVADFTGGLFTEGENLAVVAPFSVGEVHGLLLAPITADRGRLAGAPTVRFWNSVQKGWIVDVGHAFISDVIVRRALSSLGVNYANLRNRLQALELKLVEINPDTSLLKIEDDSVV